MPGYCIFAVRVYPPGSNTVKGRICDDRIKRPCGKKIFDLFYIRILYVYFLMTVIMQNIFSASSANSL